MIRNALLETHLFEAARESENKLRWDADVEATRFSLYIPKWRVPQPWPSRIWIDVVPRRAMADDAANLSLMDVQADGALRCEPIIATITRFSDHTQTIRYRPIGDPSTWEIGEPYIPTAMTRGGSERMRLIVLWDVTSRGQFSAAAPMAE